MLYQPVSLVLVFYIESSAIIGIYRMSRFKAPKLVVSVCNDVRKPIKTIFLPLTHQPAAVVFRNSPYTSSLTADTSLHVLILSVVLFAC